MGVDLRVVLAPYMEITHNPTEVREITDTINICSDTSCKKHDNRKQYKCAFCPDCGSKITPFEVKYTKNEPVDIDGLMVSAGKEDLFFYHRDLDVYLPNYLKEHRVDTDEDDVNTIDADKPQKAIQAMYDAPLYRKFFLSLDANGVKYEVKYGLITYYW